MQYATKFNTKELFIYVQFECMPSWITGNKYNWHFFSKRHLARNTIYEHNTISFECVHNH